MRGRLALVFGLLTALLVGGLGFSLVVADKHAAIDRLGDQLAIEASVAGVALFPAGDAVDPALDVTAKRLGAATDARISVIDASGRVIADSDGDPASMPSLARAPDVAAALNGVGRDTIGATRWQDSGTLAVTLPDPRGGGMLTRVTIPLDPVESSARREAWIVLFSTLLGVALSVAISFAVGARIGEPLRELHAQALAVASGQLDVNVLPDRIPELGDVARAFNTMTERVRLVVEESERSRSRLQAIFTNLSDGLILIDDGDLVVGMNGAAGRMLDRSERSAIGEPFVVVARDADLYQLTHRAQDGSSETETIDYLRSGRVLEAAVQRVASGGERLRIVVLRDITELKRLEQVRREFVANVSHELRTPLASVRAVVETLEAGAIDDPEVATEFLGRIIGEVDRLAALVDELLDLARLESGRMPMRLMVVEPGRLVRQGVERLRPQVDRAGLILQSDIPNDLPSVLADQAKIEQVMLNLVHNAVKFTPRGGTIRVSVIKDDDVVRVCVSDTGIGIREDDLNRVFERFYKSDKARSSGGTGLGLAIAKHIVQAHRGTITASSSPAAGSTFCFTLPIASAAPIERPIPMS